MAGPSSVDIPPSTLEEECTFYDLDSGSVAFWRVILPAQVPLPRRHVQRRRTCVDLCKKCAAEFAEDYKDAVWIPIGRETLSRFFFTCFRWLRGHRGAAEGRAGDTAGEATRELVKIKLLEEGAGSGPSPVFAGTSEWPLEGNTWTSSRVDAKKRLKAVKAWGTTMLAGLAAAPALTGGSGALGQIASGGA
ncbi:hypothetical protein CYMTET_17239 [Cymbomonas tetramitiformis]|uniref:Uncharacterized protein n=1 Tax=Cymbomonas tetramitiformis TaxID=36881 RepID=A0AAE0GAA4_9CHLO|nr:hypothetical protein CYMTET_17239 [Cymbomonas tetramitiformis]